MLSSCWRAVFGPGRWEASGRRAAFSHFCELEPGRELGPRLILFKLTLFKLFSGRLSS